MNKFIITAIAILSCCLNAIANNNISEKGGAIDSCHIVYGDVEILIHNDNGEINFPYGMFLGDRIFDQAYMSKKLTADIISLLQDIFINNNTPVMVEKKNPDYDGLNSTEDLKRQFMDIVIYNGGNKITDTSVSLTLDTGESIYVYNDEFKKLWELLDLVLDSYENKCTRFTFESYREEIMPKVLRDSTRNTRIKDEW